MGLISPHLDDDDLRRLMPYVVALVLGCVILLFSCILFLAVGPVNIPFHSVLLWVIGEADPQTALILGELRWPRCILAANVGAILATCGCIAQGLFRNPLADPSLIGVSAGASVGASVVIVFMQANQWAFLGVSLVSLGAFLGAMAIILLVYRLATNSTGTSVSTMLLTGIALSYLAGSFASLLEYIADSEMLKRISLWRMGGLEGATLSSACLSVVIFVLVFVSSMRKSQVLNVFLLGESEARHLGIPVQKVKITLIVAISLGVGVSVALAGVIAFVGLVVPHMMRLLVGPNHTVLLPFCALFGAILVVLADTLARTLMAPAEIPVGLIIAFIGAPLFIVLLRQRYRGDL